MAERILPTEAQDPAPTTHTYDDPDLDPLAFLTAVYHATHLPMSIRIEAASALLPYTNSVPRKVQGYVPCRIIIGGFGTDPSPTNEESQSFSISRSDNRHPQSEDQGPSNTENPFPSLNTETSSNTLYSEPPSPTEIKEIKAAINKLRPELAHLPVPEFHFCKCGHWICGPCPLGEQCRDRSKLN
jgi:hypothetical protein